MTSESITKLSIDQLRVGMTESVSKIITIVSRFRDNVLSPTGNFDISFKETFNSHR